MLKRNLHTQLYVGRGSKYGNPFKVTPTCSRIEAVKKYRVWLWKEIQEKRMSLEDLAFLADKTLYCPGCGIGHPECHGRVLEKACEWAISQLAG
jgi:hypothetical protein